MALPHRSRSAVEVQHGSSPQAISPAGLHPESEASPKSGPQAALHPSEASPKCRQECSSIFNAKRTGPPRPLTFTMAHVIPQTLSCRSPCVQQKLHPNPTENRPASSMPQPTGPSPLLTFSMVHLVYHAQPRGLPVGGGPGENRSPTVTKLPPGPWPGKGPSVASGFPHLHK